MVFLYVPLAIWAGATAQQVEEGGVASNVLVLADAGSTEAEAGDDDVDGCLNRIEMYLPPRSPLKSCDNTATQGRCGLCALMLL